ncbi:MAG: RluA family pseudouridine synthase [Planctomycetaceae bacterium]
MSRLYKRNRDLSERLERVDLVVEIQEEGRFDAFLARHIPWRSRTGVQALIEEGRALLNGARRKPSTRVRTGDRITVEVAREPRPDAPPPPSLRILHEDEHCFALDKEAGVVVHPVGAYQENTLLQELHRRHRGAELPKLAHRLDQQTSGVLLVARNDAMRRALSTMLERGEVAKRYEALLLGRVEADAREIDEPIGRVGDSRILMRVDREQGKPARTELRVVERFAHATQASLRIHTGRTHQIRVHCAALGHPLLCDHLYGDGLPIGEPPVAERFLLHARSVEFLHPFTCRPVAIEAPLPAAFLRAVEALRARVE